MKQKLGPEYWKKNIAFYLDGSGFQIKTKPHDQAQAPKSRTWRKKQGVPHPGCTPNSKRKNQSVTTLWWPLQTTLVLSYVNNMKVQLKFANIVRSGFPEAFALSSDSVR